jgi:competence protein ComEC
LKKFSRNPGPPAVRLALGFVGGAALVQQLPALPGAWAYAALALLLAGSLRVRWTGAAAAVFGILWAMGYAELRLGASLPVAAERLQAEVEGRILTIPEAMDRGVHFDFAIDRVLAPENAKLPARVRLSWYDERAAPKAGESWHLKLSLRRPRGMLNPGGFDYEQWLFAQNIRAVGYVRDSRDNRRLDEQGAANFWPPQVWRQAIYDRLSAALAGSPVAGLIEALTMGADDGITQEQWEVLRRTGTTHLIAISGSHVGLVAAVAFFLTRWLCARLGVLRWPPPRIAAMAGFAAALLYSALADFAIPTQRALVMIAVAMGAVALQRNLNPTHVLAAAALAVVLYDPMAVTAPGFWLSFGAVALIAYGIAGRVAPITGWRALARINWVTALGLAPLLLLFFRQVSLVSPLANLLAVPVLGTLLVPVCLSGALLLPIVPDAGEALLRLAEFILAWFWPALERLSALPLAQWNHAEPPFWTIPLALLGTLLLLAPRGIPARWLGLVLLLPGGAWQPERLPPGEFRLVVLDVGQGLASVVETRHRALVFDTGPRLGPNFDMGRAVIEPYLRRQGIGRIDVLVVSHGDLDHIGGARSVLTRFPVGTAYTSVPEQMPAFAAVPCAAGQRWTWDGVAFEMLGPVGKSDKENDNSCVLRVQGQGGSALLTGDIERTAEHLLVGRYGGQLRSDVLVVPHHGSNTSSTAEFLEAVRPRCALFPLGYLNRFGFPHRAVLARFGAIGTELRDTAAGGALSATTGPDGLRLSAWREEHPRYWQER